MNRWGKAGVRLTDKQAEQRAHTAVARRNQRQTRRHAEDRVAYRLWRAGELKPYLITHALNARGLYGPEVDLACGAQEPDVDLWEAGKLYPTWTQLLALAELTGKTPRFLCAHHDHMADAHTSLRFHVHTPPEPPPVWAYDPAVVNATVYGTVCTNLFRPQQSNFFWLHPTAYQDHLAPPVACRSFSSVRSWPGAAGAKRSSPRGANSGSSKHGTPFDMPLADEGTRP